MKGDTHITAAMHRAERVLAKHGVGSEELESRRPPPRSKIAIDAIIRDIRKANVEADDA